MNIGRAVRGAFLFTARTLVENRKRGIFYVVPGVGWSTDWDGYYITQSVKERFPVKIKLTSDPKWLAGHVIHFGSLWDFLGHLDFLYESQNKIVTTVFHGDKDGDNRHVRDSINILLENENKIDFLVTSNSVMKERFIEWGFPIEKLACIPLGVDLKVFRPGDVQHRRMIRKKLTIPDEAFCIGSFQKDGNGWDKGLEPKLIKGPDVFLATLREVKKYHDNVFVLLSAPARGYVKAGLEAMDIPFRHLVVDDYPELAELYSALDVYLVTSREEGGPKGPLEAMASGIPVISTRVGLVPDLITDNENGLLAVSEDFVGLSRHVVALIEDKQLGKRLASKGLETIQAYGWTSIGEQYYDEVYAPLLEKASS